MANAQDYTQALNDIMGTFPVDLSAYQAAYNAQAGYGDKLTSVALEAAEKQDSDALFDAGGRIYQVCLGCHNQYVITEGDNQE